MLSNFKKFIKDNEKDLFIVVIIVLIAFSSFGLGRLSKIEEGRVPIMVENLGASVINSVPVDSVNGAVDGKFVVSKNGTKYHYPWCSGAQRIKEENKIWFNTRAEAESAGYTPAANCKGLTR